MSDREIKPEKIAAVSEIKEKVNEASIVFVSDYRGMTVTEMTDFRAALRQDGASAKVYKNTLARRAFDELGLSYDADLLKGPSIIITALKDSVKASKVVVKYSNQVEALRLKGGFLDSQSIDESVIKELATLPTREELIAKAVGQVKAPLSGLVAQLSAPIRGLIGVLNSIEKKKQEEN